MVSFDIVSLFTKVPIKETMNLLGRHIEEDVLELVLLHCQWTALRANRWCGHGLTAFSFYMEDYEKAALESAPPKTSLLVSLRRRHLRHLAAWP
jgi:hypothetical protein